MDTSIDHASSTVDFVMGQGVNFPKPTDRDFARILFLTLDELHHSCTLADIIGNHTQDHTCNYSLQRALTEKARETNLYAAKIRAREIYKTTRADKSGAKPLTVTSTVYIACTRTDAYWLLVDRTGLEYDGNLRYVFTQLDVDSMTEFFSHFRQYADHVGLQILRELSYAAKQQFDNWTDKQQRLEVAATFLSSTSIRAASACRTPRTLGDGMEN